MSWDPLSCGKKNKREKKKVKKEQDEEFKCAHVKRLTCEEGLPQVHQLGCEEG